MSLDEFLDTFVENNKQNDDDANNGCFSFETDYLPLKSNADYLSLIKTLAILDVQRMTVHKEIEKLENLRLKAQENPCGVLKEICSSKGEFSRIKVRELPDIDWSKYKYINYNETQPVTRKKINISSDISNSSVVNSKNGKIHVRGRPFNESKPETFNQLWTAEEQLRLEQLLEEYPPEPVESNRWKKIARALGNRTEKQVCSRVQKYFKKLKKVGINLPGRQPRYTISKKPSHVYKRNKHYLYRPTTFFPGVAMKELGESESEDDSSSIISSENNQDLSHWDDILSKINEEKLRIADLTEAHTISHPGYKCYNCNAEPLMGIRWECKSCRHISMCNNCLEILAESRDSNIHPLSHIFRPFRTSTNPDYNANKFGSQNYLDPNFI